MILLPHFTAALVARSFSTWLAIRLAAMGGSMAIAHMLGAADIVRFARLSPAAVIGILLVVAAIGWVYMHRRGELRFLLSLGFGRMTPVATLLAAPVVAELCILLALHV